MLLNAATSLRSLLTSGAPVDIARAAYSASYAEQPVSATSRSIQPSGENGESVTISSAFSNACSAARKSSA